MRERFGIIGILIALGLSGCGESPSEPATDIGGTWVLRTVAGSPLPAVFTTGSPLLLVSDTLEFGVIDPAFASPVVRSTRRVGEVGGVPVRGLGHFTYSRNGDEVSLAVACPPNALCAADTRSGVIDGNTMSLGYIELGLLGYRSPLVYRRVR